MSNTLLRFNNTFLSKRYYLIYAAAAQIVLLFINIISLVTNNRDMDYNDVVYFIIPNILYVLLALMFYGSYIKIRYAKHGRKLDVTIIITIMVANFIHLVICSLNITLSYFLYFLDASIIQVINALFMAGFLVSDAAPMTTGIQLIIFRILVYAALIANVLSLVYCLDNPYLMIYAMILSSILLFLSYMVYRNHSMAIKPKKTLHQRKVRISRDEE